MDDMSVTPPPPPVAPWAPAPRTEPARRGRRLVKLAVGVGAAAGVAVGATALAQGSTAPAGTARADNATVTASGSASTTTTLPGRPHGFGGGGRFRGGIGGFGGPGLGGGPFIYGQFTIKGPNGYETLSERTGTVSTVTDTSGSTWSLTVKSADATSGTFVVDSSTSVNGGEMGIGSVKTGDTVQVTAVVSGDTSTATSVTDQTVLKANGGTWQPMGPQSGSTGGAGTSASGTDTPPV